MKLSQTHLNKIEDAASAVAARAAQEQEFAAAARELAEASSFTISKDR